MADKRKKPIALAIPSSLVAEHKHLREKTLTLGMIARAASIYRIDDIYIFRDNPDESVLIRDILSYVETPQYLRKKMFNLRPEFKFVGQLQPLRTPHHPLMKDSSKLKKNQFREGIVVSKEKEENYVDIGVERLLKIRGKAPNVGKRVTTQIIDSNLMIGRIAYSNEVNEYWGYRVHINRGNFSKLSGDFPLRIATSRDGQNYGIVSDTLERDWNKARKILIAFGSPRKGLREILSKGRGNMNALFDYELNMIPEQGTATVRTEEAIHATLAIFNQINSE